FLVIASNLRAQHFSRACVSYETEKEMFYTTDVKVIGRTCDVSILETQKNENLSIQVSFKTENLDSGSGSRDEDVAEMLGHTVFFTTTFNVEEFEKLYKQNDFQIKGNLGLKSGSFPLTMTVKKSKNIFSGYIKTSFTELGLQPPKVGPGGMMADTKNILELRFELTGK
ncbi:MAG: hypothetical protein KDK38_02820, partial [Leptospiraceae bacterium]|nr:hypothetical protein [Leptospiraceae bacterium]